MASKREVQRRQRNTTSTQGAIDNAPSGNKACYLRLPSKLKLFKPEMGKSYQVVFLPWIAGKNNSTGKKGDVVWNRFLSTHRFIGPNEDHHLCLASIGQPCAVCEFAKELQRKGDRTDDDYYKKVIAPVRPKHREIMLIHVLGDTKNPQNLQVWDESVELFGNAFRSIYSKKEKWRRFADMDHGCVVEFDAKKKAIGQNSCIDCTTGIAIEVREEPLPDWLWDAVGKTGKDGFWDPILCLDDFVVATPNEKLKVIVGVESTGNDEEGGEQEEEEPEEPEEEEEPEEPEEEEEEEPRPRRASRNGSTTSKTTTSTASGREKPKEKPKEEEEEVDEDDETDPESEEEEESEDEDGDDGDEDDDDKEEEEESEDGDEDEEEEEEKPTPRKRKR